MFELNENNGGPVIKVIGVGQAGGKILEDLMASDIEATRFLYADTDFQAIKIDAGYTPLPLGTGVTRGQGTGGHRALGRQAAQEDLEVIDEVVSDSHLVFIVAGLGGGSGSGIAPLVAEMAYNRDILTVGLVTLPLPEEGYERLDTALKSIRELRPHCDSLIVIPQEDSFLGLPHGAGSQEVFQAAREMIINTIRFITEPIMLQGIICVDLADIRAVLSETGLALMGVGRASGPGRAKKAAQAALASLALNQCRLDEAKGLLVNVAAGMDMTLQDVNEAGEFITDRAPDGPIIVVSAFIDPAMDLHRERDTHQELRVSIIAAGVDEVVEDVMGAYGKGDQSVEKVEQAMV